MDTALLSIIQHTLGLDEFGRRRCDRNYFVTGKGTTDYPHCMAAVEAGLMTRRSGNALTGWDDVFSATENGRKYVAAHSKQPPKRTRSQRRYLRFLNEDCGLSFGDWLRYGGR